MVAPVKNYSTFVRGIITEANPLTFPENASVDERNFVLKRDGSRRRRLGMDFEEGYVLGPSAGALPNATFEDLAISVSEWKNADNDPLNNFAVVQLGTELYFYNLSNSSPSSEEKGFTVDLTLHKTAYAANIGSSQVSTTVGKGVLFVASDEIEPFYLEYDPVADSILATPISIEIRDFEGVEDGYAVDERDATLTAEHNYNLQNQGWSVANITAYEVARAVYPSNADQWILGKDSSDDFDPALMDKQYFGNTAAPKGHYILDAFTRERASLTDETEEGRPSAIAFYQGRVFYAGVQSIASAGPTQNGTIFFSQSLTSLDRAGWCHQDADPTSEHISDLIDTDGGVIEIPEIGIIKKMIPLRDSLIVFADNGVWQISGGGSAFTGTNHQVDKITTVGASNAAGIIAVEAVIIYWTDSGIYILEAQTADDILGARNLTESSIQTLYNAIPSIAKANCAGAYDLPAKRISWLYNDTTGYDGNTFRYKYNKELVFDGVLQAFTINEIADLAADTPYVAGLITTVSTTTVDTPFDIQASGVMVEASAVQVQASVPNAAAGTLSTKYLVINPDTTTSQLTFGEYNEVGFMEWLTADAVGVDFLSYLVTGYELFGDMMRAKYVPYITCHFSRTETGFVTNALGGIDPASPSGCYMQSQWEWTDSAAAGRWGTAQQVYRLPRLYIPTSDADTFNDGFSVCTSKNIVRGKGKSLSLYFYSETGKDCHILGWGMAGQGQAHV